MTSETALKKFGDWETVLVELDEGIAWVTLNRPEKRNCMNPRLNSEMTEILDALEVEDGVGVLVLTGAGDSFSAGMDLKEFFRETLSGVTGLAVSVEDAGGAQQPNPSTIQVVTELAA